MTVCPLCRTNDRARTLYPANVTDDDLNPSVFSARRLPDRLHAEILRCDGCGLVYPKRLLDAGKLSELYQRSRFTYGNEQAFIRKTYDRYLRRALERLETPSPRAYLDIGCGNGFMLLSAKRLGFERLAGVEPGEHAKQSADPSVRDGIRTGMFSSDLFKNERFDLLTCFQTLDHVPDPVGFATQCMQVLKPGGVALFINHDIGSLPARLLGERCPMIDIEHTFLHTKSTMRTLFSRAGFVDIDVFPVRNDYPLYYWLHLVPGPKRMKRRTIDTLKRMPIGRMIVPLKAGNLGLIGRRP